MSINYDLHTHSTASDGTLSPNELIQRAVSVEIDVLALTDHDTLDGLAEAQATADQHDIIFVPGVEISVTWHNTTIHVVGLHVNHTSQTLQNYLNGLHGFRRWRAQEIGHRLAKHGITNAFEGAEALSNGKLIGRSHFARFLVQQGFASNEKQVFKHFLVPGKPGHVPSQWAKLEDAIAWILQAGGQAILAHPGRYKINQQVLRQLVGLFKEMGGCALEVISSSHTWDKQIIMARLANEFKLLSSVGSDFHNPQNAWMTFGSLPALPAGCIPIWQDWGYTK
ncbi:phosphoesterase [Achromatium sp. WMS1]|nr:phosphoesterase [Achromatium sp. WMS1]